MSKPTKVKSTSLPSSSSRAGDRYYATDTGHHYVWNGAALVDLGVFNDPNDATLAAQATSVVTDADQVLSADGAISIPAGKKGTCVITKATAVAATLAAPTAGTDDYKELTVFSNTAAAHVVTTPANKIQDGTSTTKDTGTFAAQKGAAMRLVAYNGLWNVISLNNVVLTEV